MATITDSIVICAGMDPVDVGIVSPSMFYQFTLMVAQGTGSLVGVVSSSQVLDNIIKGISNTFNLNSTKGIVYPAIIGDIPGREYWN